MRDKSKYEIIFKEGKAFRNNRELAEVNCEYCNEKVYRAKNKSVYKRKNFCNQVCKQNYNNPLTAKIMDHKDTPNFNYLLGLIASDGYVNRKKRGETVVLGFGSKYPDELKLLKELQSLYGGRIHSGSNKSNYIHLTNHNFYEYCLSIGLSPKKSLSLDVTKWFSGLCEENKWAFIRGCFDGDGCFTHFFNSFGRFEGRANFTSGSEPFAKMIHDFLKLNTKINKYKNNYNLNINCSNIEKTFSPMYKNIETELYLERKYLKYKIIRDYYSNI